MFCKKCGKSIDDESSFCKFCGANLNDTEASIGQLVIAEFGEKATSGFSVSSLNNEIMEKLYCELQKSYPDFTRHKLRKFKSGLKTKLMFDGYGLVSTRSGIEKEESIKDYIQQFFARNGFKRARTATKFGTHYVFEK